MPNFDSYSFFDGSSMTPVTQRTWADYWQGVIPDGVVAGVGDEMKPYADNQGMTVFISTGACFVDNHRGVVSALKSLTVSAADATKKRVDIIVARVKYGNANLSTMELAVKKGTPATSNPQPPALTQTTSVYEIKLAEILVEPGDTYVKSENVTDFRNVFECGEQAFAFKNSGSQALEKGMIVTLDASTEGGVRRCAASELPIGVVRSENIAPGATGRIDTKPGTIAEIKCNSKAVAIGDALVVGNTAGYAETGGAPYFTAGLALAAKADGIIANVKSLLTVFSKIPLQNQWYLVDGILEEDVIAAYQFVGRRSSEEALLNINQGQELPLSCTTTTNPTWNSATGFYFPNTDANGNCLLDNAALNTTGNSGLNDILKSAAFGFNMDASAEKYCGGITFSRKKFLVLSGQYYQDTTRKKLTYPAVAFGDRMKEYRANESNQLRGVLGGVWSGTSSKIFLNGVNKTVTSTEYNSGSSNASAVPGQGMNGTIGHIGETSAENVIPFYMTAVVFYSKVLNAAQHVQLSQKITALGGVS